MSEMRVLTVRQPWAWAIIHGGKDVENRVRNIAGDYRGPVAIHAGLQYDEHWASDPLAKAMNEHPGVWNEPQPWRAQIGAASGTILGVVDLVDVHSCSKISGCVDSNDRSDMRRIICSPWAEVHGTHLVLGNPRPLREPLPFTGALGLRRLDPGVVAEVLARAGGAS